MYVDDLIRKYRKRLDDGERITVHGYEVKAFNDFPVKFRKMIESFGSKLKSSYDWKARLATYWIE